MWSPLIFLLFLTSAFSQGPIFCSYRMSSDNVYECEMTIYNEAGFDGFEDIPGNHLQGFGDEDISVVVGGLMSTRNVPEIICLQFRNLVSITMRSLGIVELTQRSFGRCPWLQEINLENNNIESVNEDTFHRFFNLTTLNLSSNRIRSFGDRNFIDLVSLNTLNLQSNEDLLMTPLTFNRMQSLQSINLINCGISTWHVNWFNTLQHLEQISLSNNRLTTIPNYAFHIRSSLKEMRISNNRIQRLSRDSFGRLDGLTDLSLVNNDISSIDRRLFDHAENLINTWMSHNECIDQDLLNFNVDRNRSLGYLQECFDGFRDGPWYINTGSDGYFWNPLTMEGLKVGIRAPFGAELILSNSSTGEAPYIKIFIGELLNTRSSIEEDGGNCTRPEHRCTNNSTGVLSQFEFSDFQIFWNIGKFITVSRGLEQFLAIDKSNHLEVKHVGVRTNGAAGSWVLEGVHPAF